MTQECGLEIAPAKKRKEMDEQQLRINDVRKLELGQAEAELLEHLDPRVGAFDLGRETAIAVNREVIAALSRRGSVDAIARLSRFAEQALRGHATLHRTANEAVAKIRRRAGPA